MNPELLFKEMQEELNVLKEKFDQACKERKEYLKGLCECCENNPIEVDHPIFNEPILDITENGKPSFRLNMAFLCSACLEKLKELNKL